MGRAGVFVQSIAFGEAPRLEYFRGRWDKLVSIVDASSAQFDATAAGVPNGGAILVRPDGFVGFRVNPADETTMDALDAHLASYLIPHVGATYPRPRCHGGCALADITKRIWRSPAGST